jgi:hypothetical protein
MKCYITKYDVSAKHMCKNPYDIWVPRLVQHELAPVGMGSAVYTPLPVGTIALLIDTKNMPGKCIYLSGGFTVELHDSDLEPLS